MKFTKMHGLGNDYVYINGVEEHVSDPASLAQVLSDRRTGVGSDGLVIISASTSACVRMKMYNADGSRAQMCGNGIRCVAKYAVDHELTPGPELTIETDAGVKTAYCRIEGGSVRSVRVDMGPPNLQPYALPTTLNANQLVDQPLRVGEFEYLLTCVSMGNPHAVVFVDDLASVKLELVGPLFEHAPEFPERINTHFVRVDSRAHVTMKSWERGSGATRACGTGACAVCVAGAVTGRTDRTVTVTLPGGDLEVEWAGNDRVFMTGPAVEVFTGYWPEQPTRAEG